jgi:hypothetical protein
MVHAEKTRCKNTGMRMGPPCAAPPLLVSLDLETIPFAVEEMSARLVLPETMGGSFKEM